MFLGVTESLLTVLRWWLRTERHMALDILDQSTLHRRWCCHGYNLPQA